MWCSIRLARLPPPVASKATVAQVARIHRVAPLSLLLIVGTDADTKWQVEEAFPRAQEPKELYWIEGATHVGLYDKPQ